jgi:citrate/tricarballylate utilization protein
LPEKALPMPHIELTDLAKGGAHVMTVCNACRYCEQYCPVFPAMEQRQTFEWIDLAYLSNLCHNCGECLYACQYAPPHEFGINVPRTLADIRRASYETYCWPRPLSAAFRRQGLLTSIGMAAVFTAFLEFSGLTYSRTAPGSYFYTVMSHGSMVTLFGGVFVFVIFALAVGLARFWSDLSETSRASSTIRKPAPPYGRIVVDALRDAMTLRHLQPGSVDCASSEEHRTPWRRWFHHCTFYGFLLCFASTTVAAIYHLFGWHAPYAYSSVPVVLGTIGGVLLLIGTAGLFAVRRRRDAALLGTAQEGLDESFIALLFLTTLTGLLLLALRARAIMGPLLVVHLGVVLALFVTLPYGKFVHGLYRLVALVVSAREQAR